MKRRVRILCLLLLVLFVIVGVVQARRSLYFRVYTRGRNFYPGDRVELRLRVTLRGVEQPPSSKTALIKIYKVPFSYGRKDYKKVEKELSPYRTLEKVIPLKSRRRNRAYGRLNFKMEPLPAGRYHLVGECDQKVYKRTFTVTSIGAFVKNDTNRMVVFVQDRKTGKPARAGVRLVSHKGGKVYNTRTDSKGIAIINLKKVDFYQKEKSIIVQAFQGDNFASCYVSSYRNRDTLRGYIYTDRPVYRPGQKVFIKGIMRFERDGKLTTAKGEKLELYIKDPKRSQVLKKELKTDSFGNFSHYMKLGDEAKLGNYRIRVRLKKKTAYGSFRVEEYRKPEYKVEVKPGEDYYVEGRPVTATVKANYYFGGPVTNTEFKYKVYRTYFYPRYHFSRRYWWQSYSRRRMPSLGRHRPYRGRRVIHSGEGKTDKNGEAVISFPTKKINYDSRYNIVVEMVDKSRREVKGSAIVKVTRGNFYLRARTDRYYYEVGKKARINIVSRDYNGKPVSRKYTIKITRRVRKNKKTITKTVYEKTRKTDKHGSDRITFTPTGSGRYRVELTALDAKENKITTATYFYSSAQGSRYSWYRFRRLQIMMDKEYYNYGDTATVMITNPYPGTTALVTVEGRKLFSHRLVKFQSSAYVLKIPLKKEHAPNVFLTVSFMKDNRIHTSYHNIIIPAKENFLSLKIKSDRKTYEPRDTASFKLIARDYKNRPVSAQITMALADESVYAVYPDFTPNIQKFFYGLRRNHVYSSNSFYRNSYPMGRVPGRSRPTLGGDDTMTLSKKSAAPQAEADGMAGGRAAQKPMTQPEFTRDYFPDTAYFNPNIITDRNGTAKVNIALPDSLTTWRATARGISRNSKVGEVGKKVKVSKDVLVRLITPRFLTQKDEVVISGIVHNYLDKGKNLRAILKVKGATLLTPGKKTVNIASNGSHRFDWKVRADSIGKVEFTLTGLTDVESDAMKLKIPVIPHGTEKYDARAGMTEQMEKVELVLPDQQNRNSSSMLIQLSPSIASTMIPALKYLIGYPYGCVEQTMSRFMPCVIVAQTMRDLDIYDEKIVKELPKMVEKGLNRLYDFQKPDGGWGWWKHDKSNPYMTAYVVYGLYKAKKAGYKVDNGVLKRGISRLKSGYNSLKNVTQKAYVLFVLSETGQKRVYWANALYKKRSEMNSYSKAMLAMALHRWGRKDHAMQMITMLENEADVTASFCTWKGRRKRYSWSDNQVETTAYALMALIEIKPKSKLIDKAVRYLSISRTGRRWYSTKDTAAAVMALSRYLRYTREIYADYSGTVKLNGKVIKQFTFTSKDVGGDGIEIRVPFEKIRTGKNVLVFEKKGKGRLYYSAYMKYFSNEENIKARESGIKVVREYFRINPDKKPNEEGYLTPIQGDRAQVESQDKILVRLTLTTGQRYDYLIVEDPKPAGFEVEDTTTRYSRWRYWYAQREVRDDKVAFFVTRFNRGRRQMEYTLRAETPGHFHTMPTRAYLMYIPEIGGISDEMQFKVVEKGAGQAQQQTQPRSPVTEGEVPTKLVSDNAPIFGVGGLAGMMAVKR